MSKKFLDIRKPAYNIAWYLAEIKGEDHNQKHIYYYSLQVVLSSLVKVTIIISISFLLNIVKETILCLLVFASIRAFSGGFHADTYIKCLFYTLFISLSSIYLSKAFATSQFMLYINILIFAITIFLTARYAPVDTPNKPIISDEHRKSLRLKAISINFIWFMISCFLFNNAPYSSIIAISALFESLTLTKVFSKTALNFEIICAKICTIK